MNGFFTRNSFPKPHTNIQQQLANLFPHPFIRRIAPGREYLYLEQLGCHVSEYPLPEKEPGMKEDQIGGWIDDLAADIKGREHEQRLGTIRFLQDTFGILPILLIWRMLP